MRFSFQLNFALGNIELPPEVVPVFHGEVGGLSRYRSSAVARNHGPNEDRERGHQRSAAQRHEDADRRAFGINKLAEIALADQQRDGEHRGTARQPFHR